MAQLDPDTLLTRTQAAAALRDAGYPISDKTLSTKASRGNGPKYRRFGPRVLYTWADLLTWAESRLSSAQASTAEHEAVPTIEVGSKPYEIPADLAVPGFLQRKAEVA